MLCGVVVWFSRGAREVRGSNPSVVMWWILCLVPLVFFLHAKYCWSVTYYLSNAHSQSWYHENLCWFVAPINESLHLVTWLIARSNTFRSKMHCNAVNFVFYVSFHRGLFPSILDSPTTIISDPCVLWQNKERQFERRRSSCFRLTFYCWFFDMRLPTWLKLLQSNSGERAAGYLNIFLVYFVGLAHLLSLQRRGIKSSNLVLFYHGERSIW